MDYLELCDWTTIKELIFSALLFFTFYIKINISCQCLISVLYRHTFHVLNCLQVISFVIISYTDLYRISQNNKWRLKKKKKETID